MLVSMAALAGAALASQGHAQVVNDARIAQSLATTLKADKAGEAQAEARQSYETRQQNRTIGTLMANGRCDEARRMALEDGQFDIALRVKDLCVPAQAPAATFPSRP
jgi:hypothetical protein